MTHWMRRYTSYFVKKTRTRAQKLILGYPELPEFVRYVSHLDMKDASVLCEASYTCLREELLWKSDLQKQFYPPTHFKERWMALTYKGICLSEIGYHDYCGGGKEMSYKARLHFSTASLPDNARNAVIALLSKLSAKFLVNLIWKQDCWTEIRF